MEDSEPQEANVVDQPIDLLLCVSCFLDVIILYNTKGKDTLRRPILPTKILTFRLSHRDTLLLKVVRLYRAV
jgi:hypothetical protein